MPAMKVPNPPPRFVTEPAPAESAFRFRSGAASRSLAEFAEHLRAAPPDALWYHRTHFAPWIRHVLGDDPLARRVEALAEEARDAEVLREMLADLVGARLAQLGARAAPR